MRRSLFSLWTTVVFGIVLCALPLPTRAQDVIFVNGKIVTLNDRSDVVQALAVANGRITAVGSNDEIRRLAGPRTRVVDLGGKTTIPGFYDNHVHGGGALQEWNGGMIGAVPEWLRDVDTMDELLAALRQRAAGMPPGEWLRGSLPREIWPNQKVPTRWDLDRVAADRPIALSRGPHTLLLNSQALQLAGITRDTPNPPGGWIIRDASGEPTGRVLEAARRLVTSAMPPERAGRNTEGEGGGLQRTRSFLLQLAGLGITSVNIAGVGAAGLGELQELYQRFGEELPRATVQVRLSPGFDSYDNPEEGVRQELAKLEALGFRTGFGSDRLKLGAVKMSIDGGLSAPVFWSTKPYKGRPDFYGAQRIPDEAFYRVARRAHELGWQLGIHTMGDAAVVMVVDQLERILGEMPRSDHRHYLHHVAVKPPEATLQKMSRLGIMVASQPGFTVGLGAYAEEALDPEREATQNPTRSLLDHGIAVSYGSDAGPYGPLLGIHAAVTRRGWDGKVRGPEEAVSVERALRLHTVGSAHFTFDEKTRGTLEVGKVADLAVLSDDILTMAPERIKEIRVERTILGGREIYARRAATSQEQAR